MVEVISVQGLPFLSCLVMLAILVYIGIHVLKREVIFIDIALAQIAAVGAIAAHVAFHWHGHSIYAHVLALGSTLIAAAFFAIVRRRIVEIPLEAVIGVSYAVSAAAALFMVGVAPGGHVHIHEMLAGSILWATWSDVLWSAGVFAVVGMCFVLFRKPFRTISESYESAIASGYNTLGWDFLFYALLGVVITVAVRIAGVVVVFTFLIIPATLSAAFASGWTVRLAIAWVAGAVSAALGLLFADRYDFSVGPAIGLFLGAALVVVGLLRLARTPKIATATAWLAIAVILGVWFGAGTGSTGAMETDVTRATDDGSATKFEPHTFTHSHGHDHEAVGIEHTEEGETEGIDETRLASVSDAQQLASIYAEATDVEERSLVVCRLLDVDAQSGVRMALGFLEGDPPLLFRRTVADKLEAVIGRPIDYDIDQPFESAANQKVVGELKKELGVQ
ncbi:MAG: metal ABC transporter permease [Candidatus Latescibacterota bacterium]|nr:MAG: metal ABC transporter permease [Candidatus Latescibacterota bacterium]